MPHIGRDGGRRARQDEFLEDFALVALADSRLKLVRLIELQDEERLPPCGVLVADDRAPFLVQRRIQFEDYVEREFLEVEFLLREHDERIAAVGATQAILRGAERGIRVREPGRACSFVENLSVDDFREIPRKSSLCL